MGEKNFRLRISRDNRCAVKRYSVRACLTSIASFRDLQKIRKSSTVTNKLAALPKEEIVHIIQAGLGEGYRCKWSDLGGPETAWPDTSEESLKFVERLRHASQLKGVLNPMVRQLVVEIRDVCNQHM